MPPAELISSFLPLRAGKCRLVRPEGLRRLAAAHSGLRLSAAHYLDG